VQETLFPSLPHLPPGLRRGVQLLDAIVTIDLHPALAALIALIVGYLMFTCRSRR